MPKRVCVPAGAEFDALSPEQQTSASKSLAVFARVEPLHKLRLVELLRDQVGLCRGGGGAGGVGGRGGGGQGGWGAGGVLNRYWGGLGGGSEGVLGCMNSCWQRTAWECLHMCTSHNWQAAQQTGGARFGYGR
jgi:hypothetical protein